MPALVIQFLDVFASLFILVFVGFYLFSLNRKEKTLHKREVQIDTEYHQIVDNALAKERKILEDAALEAQKIIADAHHTSQTTSAAVDQALQKMLTDIQTMSHSSTGIVDQSLKKAVADAQQQADATTNGMMNTYTKSLQELTTTSLTDFQHIIKGLETDLQKQIAAFHTSLLPNLEKELEEYKKARMKETEQTIARVVQKASQEILNKSISLEDHQTLLIQSLEKAKKEGIFD